MYHFAILFLSFVAVVNVAVLPVILAHLVFCFFSFPFFLLLVPMCSLCSFSLICYCFGGVQLIVFACVFFMCFLFEFAITLGIHVFPEKSYPKYFLGRSLDLSVTGTVLVGITKKSRTQMRECFHRHYVRKLCTWHVLTDCERL